MIARTLAPALLAAALGCSSASIALADAPVLIVEASAEVAVDGQRRGNLHGRMTIDLAPGEHEILIQRRTCGSGAPWESSSTQGKCRGTPNSCVVKIHAAAGQEYVVTTRLVDRGEPLQWQAQFSTGESCTPPEVQRLLLDRELFLCCNLFFNRDHDATDANYLYPVESRNMLAAGTRVRVADLRGRLVTLQTEDGQSYYLELRHGVGQIDAGSYFAAILLDDDRSAELAAAPKEIQEKIRAAELSEGMTRAQATLARGYPPLHQTESWEAATWLYYDGLGRGQYVTFEGDVIKEIRAGEAP